MDKYRVVAKVRVEVAVEIKATSLEHALQQARELEREDPVRAGLIAIPRRAEYLWNDETELSGVMAA